MSKFIDITGKVYGNLTVINRNPDYVSPSGEKQQQWNCLCSCGNETVVRRSALRAGLTKSCGCLNHLGHPTHGACGTRLCRIWYGMRGRCYCKTHSRYNLYGGRGIKICQRWRDSFENFACDMGYPPTAKHSIHRIDNDGDYEPSNCVWATQKEQTRNTRRNALLTVNAETKCVTEWSEIMGINPHTIWSRLNSGWTPEDAVLTKVKA